MFRSHKWGILSPIINWMVPSTKEQSQKGCLEANLFQVHIVWVHSYQQLETFLRINTVRQILLYDIKTTGLRIITCLYLVLPCTHGNPLQYSCLENPMDGGTWWAAVHGVAKSQTRLSDWLHFHFSLSCIGEGNGNPLQCSCLENPRDGGAWWAAVYRSHRVRHDWSDLAAAAYSLWDSKGKNLSLSGPWLYHLFVGVSSLSFYCSQQYYSLALNISVN